MIIHRVDVDTKTESVDVWFELIYDTITEPGFNGKTFDEMYDYDKSESNYTDDMYTEELFKVHSIGYILYEIDLHDDEKLDWSEYDGQSCFKIVKKKTEILSTMKRIN